MIRSFTAFAPLFLGLVMLALGIGLLGTLLGIRMADNETSPLAAGLVMTGYFTGQFLGSVIIQRWIESVGHIRTYAAFTAILSATAIAHPLGFETTFWAVLRFAQGFCMAGLLLCVESWLNSRSTAKTRGQVLASYMIVYYGAYALSQTLLNLPDPSGYSLYVVASMLISLAAVPIAITRVDAPEIPKRAAMSLRELLDSSPTAIVGVFLSGIILGAFYGLAPFYARGIGVSVAETAGFMTAVVLGGLAMQWPIGHLSDRMDRRRVIAAVNVLLAVAASAIALIGAHPYWALLAAGALFGGFSFTVYPLCVANANDRIQPDRVVAASRGLLMAYSAGAVLGPISGAIVLSIDPRGVFLLMAVLAALTTAFAIARMGVAEAPPHDEVLPFQAMPQTTPEIAELDPRGEPPTEATP